MKVITFPAPVSSYYLGMTLEGWPLLIVRTGATERREYLVEQRTRDMVEFLFAEELQ